MKLQLQLNYREWRQSLLHKLPPLVSAVTFWSRNWHGQSLWVCRLRIAIPFRLHRWSVRTNLGDTSYHWRAFGWWEGPLFWIFGLAFPSSLPGQFLEFSEHPICELELLPVLVDLQLWATLLYHSHVVFYSDNNAARSALVRADEATLAARGIVTEFVKLEKPLHWLTWFGRVPAHSIPADVASRLAFIVPWLFQAKQSRWSCSRTWVSGVFARVLRKQDTGKHSPKSSIMSATLWWRKNMICIPGSKHVTYRLCPDFASNQSATKKRGWHRFHCWTFVLFHLVGLQNFHFFVQWTFVLSGNVCFMFLVGERFAYLAYDD